jgi:hypothetical protein
MAGMLSPMELEEQPQSMFGGRRRRGSRRMGRSIMSEFQRQGRSQGQAQAQGQGQGQQGGINSNIAKSIKRISTVAEGAIGAIAATTKGALTGATKVLSNPQKGGKKYGFTTRRRRRTGGKSRKHKKSHRRH